MSPRFAAQRVDQSVRDHVAVGVPGETLLALDADPAEDQRDAVLERVRVEAAADAVFVAHPSGSCRPWRPWNTVTVS
jgi:hypothetical protein